MAKRETLEDVIRMAVRVQTRMSKEGIGLRWTVHFEPCVIPGPDKPDPTLPAKKRRNS